MTLQAVIVQLGMGSSDFSGPGAVWWDGCDSSASLRHDYGSALLGAFVVCGLLADGVVALLRLTNWDSAVF